MRYCRSCVTSIISLLWDDESGHFRALSSLHKMCCITSAWCVCPAPRPCCHPGHWRLPVGAAAAQQLQFCAVPGGAGSSGSRLQCTGPPGSPGAHPTRCVGLPPPLPPQYPPAQALTGCCGPVNPAPYSLSCIHAEVCVFMCAWSSMLARVVPCKVAPTPTRS
jgi:hypothetical protein